MSSRNKLHGNIEICKTKEFDCEGIANLVNRTSSLGIPEISSDYYYNTYFKNPVGKAYSFVAKDGEKVVAHFCILPKKYLVNGNKLVIGKTMDIFTDSNYQKRGLATKLSKLAFEEALNDKITFFFITPSNISAPIYIQKFGFKESFTFFEYWTSFELDKILREKYIPPLFKFLLKCWHKFWQLPRYNKLSHLNDFSFEKRESLDEEVNEFWNRVKDSYSITPVKDYSYLKWRYITNPIPYDIFFVRRGTRLEGILVLRTTIKNNIKIGIIMDLIYNIKEYDVFHAMLEYSCAYFKDKNCLSALVWAPGTKYYRDMLSYHNFYPYIYGIKYVKKSPRRILIKSWFNDKKHLPFFNEEIWSFSAGDGNDY